MEKKTWIRPQAEVQIFVANEYVAACGDSGTHYKFICDAGSRWSSYNVYLNGPDNLPGTSDDIPWTKNRGTSFSPCGEPHEADVNSDFQSGYMYERGWGGSDSGRRIDVIVWTNGGTNTHCTKELDINSWFTTRS